MNDSRVWTFVLIPDVLGTTAAVVTVRIGHRRPLIFGVLTVLETVGTELPQTLPRLTVPLQLDYF